MATTAFQEEHSSPSVLADKIREHIKASGRIPFRQFMAAALYDPQHGYYASGQQRVGKDGDFITSISAGRCFGMILAHRLERYWKEIGQPRRFDIIEPGAHNGALCLDILNELQNTFPSFYNHVSYHLIETADSLREAQLTSLSPHHAGKFHTHKSIGEITDTIGALISNELIDALPVDLIRKEANGWQLLMVSLTDEGAFQLEPQPIPDNNEILTDFCNNYAHLPEGYTTEFQPNIGPFAQQVSRALKRGLFLTIDYGHYAEDYYHPDRTEGTLQTYQKHNKGTNPLATPGEIDISAHVDFTRLQSESELAGFKTLSLSTQASYLTHQAKEWLIEVEQSPTVETSALLRQFQTLTHPAMLGTRFMVLEMTK